MIRVESGAKTCAVYAEEAVTFALPKDARQLVAGEGETDARELGERAARRTTWRSPSIDVQFATIAIGSRAYCVAAIVKSGHAPSVDDLTGGLRILQ